MTGEFSIEELEEQIPELNMGAKYEHQVLIFKIAHQLYSQLEDRNCDILGGTYLFLELSYEEYVKDRIKALNNKDVYEEPDLMVICEKSNIQIREGRVFGVPRFIIEVLSPSTSANDTLDKKIKYQKSGVEEYWIIDISKKKIYQHLLQQDYRINVFSGNPITVPISIFNNEVSIIINWDSLIRF